MNKNIFETIVGGMVLSVAIYFVLMVYNQTNPSAGLDGYNLIAKFDRADGISVGSDVRIGGVKVGTVVDQNIDLDTYLAVITMNINNKIKFPKDTSAEIMSSSLIGNKYVSLTAGGEDEMLANNDEILYTQSAMLLESMISKFIFGANKDAEKDNIVH